MIKRDAAFYCCDCNIIFDFHERQNGECPACGNRQNVSINQMLKAKETCCQPQTIYYPPIIDLKMSYRSRRSPASAAG